MGIVQGLTEFLPISSSGHLVIFQYLLGIKEPELFFDILLHVGTLLSTVIIFRKEILKALKAPRAVLLLVIGSVPVAIVGFILLDFIEQSFGSIQAAGLGLLVTGTVLWFTKRTSSTESEMRAETPLELFSNISMKQALTIGIAQSIALFPGISRSGMTIATALFLKSNRRDAATFSFLLSIPGIIGAIGLKTFDMQSLPMENMLSHSVGLLSAFIVGIIALVILVRLVLHGHFYKFSYYCWPVGMAILLYGLL